jgi:hypothetical protein
MPSVVCYVSVARGVLQMVSATLRSVLRWRSLQAAAINGVNAY